jgi:putative glutathione S-transferase
MTTKISKTENHAAATVNFDLIKRHYYYTHDDINPTRIVPIGPALDLTKPHGRDRAYPVG